MKRPRLYAAFGDKATLQLEPLGRYWRFGLVATPEAFADGDLGMGPQALGSLPRNVASLIY